MDIKDIKAPTGTYCVYSRVSNMEIISKIARVEKLALEILSVSKEEQKIPRHVTLTPRFRTSCLDVTTIASACTLAKKIKNHPITLAPFRLGGLTLVPLKSETLLCFDLIIHEESNLQALSYISALNSKVESLAQFELLPEEPKTLTLHLQVLRIPKHKPVESLARLIRSESQEKSSLFYLSHPELYIKTKQRGWVSLLENDAEYRYI